MSKWFKRAIISSLLGMVFTSALAQSNQQANLEQQLEQLQQQVNELRAQLHAQRHAQTTSAKTTKYATHARKASKQSGTATQASGNESTVATQFSAPTGNVSTLPSSGATYIPVDVDVPGQSFVSSGPYIGIPLQFAGNNLIVNTPSVNQDVALLKVRKSIHQRLQALGIIEEPDHAHVLLSGEVQGQAMHTNIGGGSSSSDIDLTNVTLDAYILGPTQWLSSLISLTYDNNLGTQSGSLANNSRDLNSRVYINQAFFTLGNFSLTPFYGTTGQYYVPFGTYASSMISNPLTQSMARTKARAILFGYQPQQDTAFYASAYIFKGDSHTGSTSGINDGGINLGYHFTQDKFNGDIGGGVLANLADSVGMQDVANNANTFNGFGGVNGTGNERIVHRVPAYDIRAMLNIGSAIDLIGEYITAATSFNAQDMTMNNHAAKPQALNVEAAYSFSLFARPTSLAVGYGMTKDALAIQLPAQRYIATLNTSIWKDTLQSLEFRRDRNYGASNFATGSTAAAPTPSGKFDTAVTAQFSVFF